MVSRFILGKPISILHGGETITLICIFLFLVVVNINVEIKLSHKKFEEELKNQSSSKYKKLEENVYVEVNCRLSKIL